MKSSMKELRKMGAPDGKVEQSPRPHLPHPRFPWFSWAPPKWRVRMRRRRPVCRTRKSCWLQCFRQESLGSCNASCQHGSSGVHLFYPSCNEKFQLIACSSTKTKTKSITETKAFVRSCMFWNKPVTNEPIILCNVILRAWFVRHRHYLERTKTFVLGFVFVFGLAHEQAISLQCRCQMWRIK